MRLKKVVLDYGLPRHKLNPGYGVGVNIKLINNKSDSE